MKMLIYSKGNFQFLRGQRPQGLSGQNQPRLNPRQTTCKKACNRKQSIFINFYFLCNNCKLNFIFIQVTFPFFYSFYFTSSPLHFNPLPSYLNASPSPCYTVQLKSNTLRKTHHSWVSFFYTCLY